MSEMKHTPGPWKLFIDDTGGQWSGWPLCIDAENDDDKTVVRTGGQWPYEWDAAMSQREAVANARLIAAAPELLEALRVFGDLVDTVEKTFPNDPVSAGQVCRGSVSFKDFQRARDAITKATGAPQ